MDQFCAACTSLPITQTSIAVREEKAKLLQLDKQSKNSVVESPRSIPPVRAGDNSDAATREADLKGSSTDSSDVTLRSHEERANALQSNNQGSVINDSASDRNRNYLQSTEQQQSQSFYQQMQHQHQQQQQQQQQPYRWSESSGEPLSRRHSVDSTPRIQIQGPLRMDGSRIHPNYTGPDRSAYSPGVSSSRAGEGVGDRDDMASGNFQRLNASSSSHQNQNQNQSQYLTQNPNHSHHQLHHQQQKQQQPSMASSLLAEGLSRMMDFLSKSPSQKSSIPQQQQHQPQRSPSISNNYQSQGYSNQQPSAYGGRNRASSYSDVDNRSRNSSGGFEGSDSIRTPTQSHLSQRKHGVYQNAPSNEEHRRARMASVFEEKEIPKGMRLSGSDEGFVLVDPSPLPAPPHPWRGATAGNSNVSLKSTHSTSGKSVSSGPLIGVTGSGAQGWTDGGVRDSESTSGKYRNQNALGPNQNQIQGSGRAEQQLQLQQVDYAGSIAQQQQKQLSAMESQHLRLPNSREKYSRSDSSPLQSDNEKILIAGVTQQAEYVCQVVLCIVSVGDGLAEDILMQEKNNQGQHQWCI